MKWRELLETLRGFNVFESSMLLAGEDSPADVARQLARWVASGRLTQLRRGLYVVAPPFAAAQPDPMVLAGLLRSPSYVSLQSALSYHGVIPEAVAAVTSVTTRRPGRVVTPLGEFHYRNVKRDLFWGYDSLDVGAEQRAWLADAEKALLDLFWLTPGKLDASFLEELRMDPGRIDALRLEQHARRSGQPKLIRAAGLTARFLQQEHEAEVPR